jgi:YD repeat-containing protein
MKMDNTQSRILISSVNSFVTEMYFSGAERVEEGDGTVDYFEGEVLGASYRHEDVNYAHTGKASVAVPSGQKGFVVEGEVGIRDEFSIQDYRASVWVHKSNVSNARLKYEITNTGTTEEVGYNDLSTVKAGDWYLLQIDIPANELSVGSTLRVSTSNIAKFGKILCYFDDFRLQPLTASANSYVYDDRGNLSAVLDANNFATRYAYDQAGRLLSVSREIADKPSNEGGFKKLQEYEYNYGREID